MTDTVMYSCEGAVARIVLNRPERHNSLGKAELTAIQDCLRQLKTSQECRVLVITGAGDKTFCAGANLQEMNSGEMDGELFQATTDAIADLSLPTVAALNGNIFGGGVELALACDYRIGLQGTKMRVPAAAIGLCYPVTGIQRFVSRLGTAAAKRILMSAEEFDSDGMRDIGFVDYLVQRDELWACTEQLTGRLKELAPLSVMGMKAIINQCALGSFDPAAAEVIARRCMESQDLKEGFAAQAEKRKPLFSGS